MANVDVQHGDTIRDAVGILLGCVERGQNRGNQRLPFILMAPRVLRDVSPSSFNPRMVSIGPLHRDDESLQEFQVQKETYLHDLLGRVSSPREQTLIACVQKGNASIDRIKACYAESETYNDIQLVTMMVLDCCFIIEFLHKLPSLEEFFVSCVAVDLMLLENQIPFFVLQDIFECTRSETILSTFLTGKLLQLLEHIDPFHGNIDSNKLVGTYTTPDHILGLLHNSFHLPSASENIERFQESPTPHTATELSRAGVNFEPNEDENWPMTMNYEPSWFMWVYRPWGKPTLKMPKLYIEDGTEPVLRNFIAYEQSSGKVHHYFTSYATAMDMLVDAQEDIEKLVKSQVIVNDLGSDEEAAKMINDICKQTCIIEFFYSQEWKEMDSYYRGYWPKNIARLRRTYFNSPWNAIALLAGIILFALTVVQTVFTIKAV